MFRLVLRVDLIKRRFAKVAVIIIFAVRSIRDEDGILLAEVRVVRSIHVDADEASVVRFQGDADVLFEDVRKGTVVAAGDVTHFQRHLAMHKTVRVAMVFVLRFNYYMY